MLGVGLYIDGVTLMVDGTALAMGDLSQVEPITTLSRLRALMASIIMSEGISIY